MRWPYALSLVTAAKGARQQRWVVDTSIEIVRRLAAQRRVVLVDLAPGSPSATATALGLEPGAGIVDVLFRGASFSATAVRPPSETFHYLQLGADPPPMSVLLQHARWEKIAQRLPETGAHLVLSVPAEVWLEAGPARGFESSIVLNATGEDLELPAGARQLAEFLAPLAVREAPDVPVDSMADAEAAEDEAADKELVSRVSQPTAEDEGLDVGASDAVGRAGAGPLAEPAAAEAMEEGDSEKLAPPDEAAASTSSAFEPQREALTPPDFRPGALARPRVLLERGVAGRKTRGGLLSGLRRRSVVPAAGVAAAAVLAFAFWRVIADGGQPVGAPPLEAAAETVAVAEPGPAAAGAPEATPVTVPETKLPFSVAIASYSSFEDAEARRRKLTRPDLPVYVAPTPVRGVVWYRVFAGILPERQQAEELMAQLVREGIKDTIRGWDIRPARYAFSFGTYDSARDASAVVETLFGRGVPAYIVPARRAGEAVGFHVYAGGYESEEDGRVLRERIERAGLELNLVERVGLISR